MNKKIYNTPVVELAEWMMTGMLCNSPTGDPVSGEVGGKTEEPAGLAPRRRVF